MDTPLADLIAARRPHRADARRNFDALVKAATEAYTELGPDVPMEDIARRAGVGIATLYRNFPARVDLMEHVYLTSIDDLVHFGQQLDRADAWAALSAWLSRFVTHLATKHVLTTVLTRESAVYLPTREAIYGIADPLFDAAQRAGAVRADVTADDVMRLVFAVTAGIYVDDAQRQRAIAIVLDGIRG